MQIHLLQGCMLTGNILSLTFDRSCVSGVESGQQFDPLFTISFFAWKILRALFLQSHLRKLEGLKLAGNNVGGWNCGLSVPFAIFFFPIFLGYFRPLVQIFGGSSRVVACFCYEFKFGEKYDMKAFYQPDFGIMDLDGHGKFPRSIGWLSEMLDGGRPVTLVIKNGEQQRWKSFPIYVLTNASLTELFPRATQADIDTLMARCHFIQVTCIDDIDIYNITSEATGPKHLVLPEEVELNQLYNNDSSDADDF